MNLYELTGAYLELSELLSDPEADAESISAALDAIGGEIEQKADNIARMLQNMKVAVDGIKAEQMRLAKRKAALEAGTTRLKEYLQSAMNSTGKRKFKTQLFSFSIQANGGKIPVIVDVDTAELPDELVVVTEKPDLEKIGEFITAHPDSKIAHFGERGESLRIR